MKTSFLKKSLFVGVVFLVVIVMFGCSGSKKVSTTPPILKPAVQPKLEEYPGYKYWTPKSFDEIDSIFLIKKVGFYNSTEILLLDTVVKKVPRVDDEGMVHIVDSLGYINITIPAFTKGEIVIKTTPNKSSPIVALFPAEGEKYEFEFILGKDTTFLLNLNKVVDINFIVNKKKRMIKPVVLEGVCRTMYKRIAEIGQREIK